MGSCYSKSKETRKKEEEEAAESDEDKGRWKRKKKWDDMSVIPGTSGTGYRLCFNSSSKVGCLYTQQGKKGTNQDAMLLWENFSSRSDTVFCGVFDGHGPFGHMVAKKVRDCLPLILSTQWKSPCSNSNDESPTDFEPASSSSPSVDDEWCEPLLMQNGNLPQVYAELRHSMFKAFKLMDKDLKLHPTIDCFCSGTTAVALVKQGDHIVIGNVGDSRAVLATRDKDNALVSVQLTVDLKPDLPGEAARIQRCKGRVFALQDEPEVARVWLPNNDSPGLAMARAFGDFCLKDFGLISVPDVHYHHVTERDEFIILATDGVWDVLSNKEAVDIVASAPGHTTAARALVDCAVRAWRLKYPTSKNDDCAVVCLFLENLSSASTAAMQDDRTRNHKEALEKTEMADVITGDFEADDSHAFVLEHSGTLGSSNEIVPVSEVTEEKSPVKGQTKRSLAECISTADDDEWSALEGVTRVNSLLSLPRFLSGERRSASWRKWL